MLKGKFSTQLGKVIPKFKTDQCAIYLFGAVVFSVGASCFIESKLGTDPLDVFSLGLKKHLPVTIGMAQGGFAALCLVVWALWNQKRPPVSPFFTFFFCGSLIDLCLWTNAAGRLHWTPYFLLLAGVTLCAIGSASIIMSGIGIRAMDLVAITMHNKLNLPFWLCKGMLEALLLVSGWLMGGPVGIGTIWFLAIVGWTIQPIMWMGTLLFRIPNYGLARAAYRTSAKLQLQQRLH